MNYNSSNISDPMDREKNGVKYEILEYMNEKIDAPLDDLMYDLVDELLDEPRDDSEYSSSDERMENTDFYLTELTQTEETQCLDQAYFYATVILSGLLGLALLLLILVIIYHWRIRRQLPGGKKVSRAESWRYESNIYVNPARPKTVGGVPVYVAPPVAPPLQRSIPHTTIMEKDEDETTHEDSHTEERVESEAGSTRVASPQQSPILLARRDSESTGPPGYSRNSTINSRSGFRPGTPGTSPLCSPHTSPLLPRPGRAGHNRTGSTSNSGFRGVDVIRCTKPGYPPPSPAGDRRRLISLTEQLQNRLEDQSENGTENTSLVKQS